MPLIRKVSKSIKQKGWEGGGEKLTGMNDVHSSHGAAGVVEDPLLVRVDVFGDLNIGGELVNNVLHDGLGVAWVGLDAALGDIGELLEVEDVKGLEVLLNVVGDRGEDGDQDGEELEQTTKTAAALATTTAAGAALGGGRALLVCHCCGLGLEGKGWRGMGRGAGRRRGKREKGGKGIFLRYSDRPIARVAHLTLSFLSRGRRGPQRWSSSHLEGRR